MAIDSAQKRYSLLGFGSPVPRLLPIPQGSFSADDRALLLYLYSGIALGEAAAAAETFSGGWRRPPPRWPAEETDTERRDRIKAERVKRGIIEPDPENQTDYEPAGGESAVGAASTGTARRAPTPGTPVFDHGAYDAALALNLAQLHTGAYLDDEIRRHFRILEDEDDAAVLLLAIATLH